MKTPLPVYAALAWGTLGMKWIEMMSASGQVIARRTSRNNTPAQWAAMGSEKVAAAIESSSAMTRQMADFPSHDPMAIWHAWARVLSSGVAPFHARAVRNARTRRKRR